LRSGDFLIPLVFVMLVTLFNLLFPISFCVRKVQWSCELALALHLRRISITFLYSTIGVFGSCLRLMIVNPSHLFQSVCLRKKVISSTLFFNSYPSITYYWTGLLIWDHSYVVGNFTNSKIAETKPSEPQKSWHFCISNFRTC
jgi:hypothetical protein